MKYMLAPGILLVMILIVANAVVLTVRERMTEMAVLKVLGFRPLHILTLVLGETLLVGVLAGLLGSVITYVLVNVVMGGIRMPFGFFPIYFVPLHVFWWGPVLGGVATLAGSIIPALFAQKVRVSQIFARVA
jgi:putative ABC transport system permease protein